ncbi:MAG: hypothetical protein NZL95_06330 [Chitinophagales bacterium]|nr:hypothetical protein [Chitinophagales bacterium]MDW8428154.1 hypothetical protein [Chitinophagales bacterium]
MKKFALLAMLLQTATIPLQAQQPSSPKTLSIEQLLGRWQLQGMEEFGVFTPVTEARAQDQLHLLAEGSYFLRWEGKEQRGTFRLSPQTRQLSFTDAASKKTITYTVKKVTDSTLVLEYQTPDLVRTRYRFLSLGRE